MLDQRQSVAWQWGWTKYGDHIKMVQEFWAWPQQRFGLKVSTWAAQKSFTSKNGRVCHCVPLQKKCEIMTWRPFGYSWNVLAMVYPSTTNEQQPKHTDTAATRHAENAARGCRIRRMTRDTNTTTTIDDTAVIRRGWHTLPTLATHATMSRGQKPPLPGERTSTQCNK